MIAKKKYCELILNNPSLLGDLVKKNGGALKLKSIETALNRASLSIRRSAALIETLKEAGYSEDEIFETETAK